MEKAKRQKPRNVKDKMKRDNASRIHVALVCLACGPYALMWHGAPCMEGVAMQTGGYIKRAIKQAFQVRQGSLGVSGSLKDSHPLL